MAAVRRGMPLHTRIFLGLVLGALAGIVVQATVGPKDERLAWFNANVASTIGNIFLYMIFMVVVPLIFSALVLGVAELGRAAKVGRIGFYSLGFTIVLSTIAVTIAFVGVNWLRPGERISEERRQDLIATYSDREAAEKQLGTARREPDDPPLLGFIPRNPFKEINRALEGGLLPLMFFALVFGLALAKVEPEKALPVQALFDGIFAASLKIIEWAMNLAPIGVFALIFRTASSLGMELFQALGLYVALVLVSLLLHLLITYSVALRIFAGRNPWQFMVQVKTVILTAFATSSSNATLPTALRVATDEVGLPRRVSSFVLTVGATANQNGTALFEGITIVFLAQLFGVSLSTVDQLTIMGLAIVAGIGTAGVPGGAWPMIVTILVMYQVPAEAIGIVLGIDRILDMSRTVLNVYGDMTIAACVTRWSGEDSNQATMPEEAFA